MRTLERKESNTLFLDWWDSLTFEWFKVEVLQDYSGEDNGPSLQAWLAGNHKESIKLMKSGASSEWVDSSQQKVKAGVEFIRVHIIEYPFTEYIEWEIQHYKNVNIPMCGEQVFIIDKADVKNMHLPSGDFMIFDNKRVVLNDYDNTGKMIRQTFYDEKDDISEFLKLKSKLLKLAQRV